MMKFIGILIFFTTALYAKPNNCLYYCKGQIDFGLGFSGGTYNSQNYRTASGRFGFFVLNGLEAGISFTYQSYPVYVLPSFFIRYFVIPNRDITPLFIGELGYLKSFQSGYNDSLIGSAGGGIAIRMSPHISFTIYLIYRKYFNSQYLSGLTYGGGFGYYF